MDDVSESLKETIKTRLSNPLWGYITLSWLGFNWQNIAILFMSDDKVQSRITEITSKECFLLHYLVVPIIAGFLLAAISPYLQLFIAKTHLRANDKQLAAETKQAININNAKSEIAESQVKADNARELAVKALQFKILEIEEKEKREQLKTDELRNQFNNLCEAINNNKISLQQFQHEKKQVAKQAVTILDLIEKFNPKTIDEIAEFQKKIYEIIDLNEIHKIKENLALLGKHTETN